MDAKIRDYYKFQAALLEPWDGPALVCFTDGDGVGAHFGRQFVGFPVDTWVSRAPFAVIGGISWHTPQFSSRSMLVTTQTTDLETNFVALHKRFFSYSKLEPDGCMLYLEPGSHTNER